MSSTVLVGLIGTLVGALLGAGATLLAPWLVERRRQRERQADAIAAEARFQADKAERRQKLIAESGERSREGAVTLRVSSRLAVEEIANNLDIALTPSQDCGLISWEQSGNFSSHSHKAVVLPLEAIRVSHQMSGDIGHFKASIKDVCRLRTYLEGAAEIQFLNGIRSSLESERNAIMASRVKLRDLLLTVIDAGLPTGQDESLGVMDF